MSKLLTKEGYLLKKNKFKKNILIDVRKELTVEPYMAFKIHNSKQNRFPVFTEDDDYISVPKFYGLKRFGKPDENHEESGQTVNFKFKGKPRPNQKHIIDTTIKHMEENDGGLISVGCGVGKTFMGLYIASHFKVKTLIIVHKTFLLNQWKERIAEFTNANVGIIQQNNVDIEDKQFVVGMLQSIAKDKYDYDIFSDFGLIIFDEAHHAPSEYFSKALPIISCKKSLALSATPKRSDKMEKILFWYLGDIAYQAPPNENTNVSVKIYNYDLDHKKFAEAKLPFTGEVNRPKTINRIVALKKRNNFIITIIKEILVEDGRKILILSDRIEHLKELKEKIDELKVTCGFYIGGKSQKQLEEASKAQILLGSYGMASEGLDIPTLNTLIMTTPRREVEQSVGRIIRKKGKIQPLIIDIVDMLPSLSRQGNHRRKLYKKLKYNIKLYDVENNNIMTETDLTNNKDIKIENGIVDFIDD
uniref:Helicase ATP-binding domain-containing protein n=1 Tax=viral metagenome TaxID=1070528 RepID=A0A6C0J975_9ZZZZ